MPRRVQPEFPHRVSHLKVNDVFVTRDEPDDVRVVKAIRFNGNAVIVDDGKRVRTYHDYADIRIIRRGA